MELKSDRGFYKCLFRFLRFVCPDHLYEEIEGDLIQNFNRDARSVGEKNARKRLVWNALRFLRPGIVLRNKLSFEFKSFYMFQSYFKIAYRHLTKSKTFSFLNIAGLAVGIASFLVILQYVNAEMSYDQFHENKERVYRIVYTQYKGDALINSSAKNFLGLGSWLKEEFPEVEVTTRFWKIRANAKFLLHYDGKLFNESGNRIVSDSSFFKVFPSFLLRGNPETVLKSRHSLVISERIAHKIFGEDDPVGKIIAPSEYNDQYEITGIIRNPQGNTHLDVDFISPQDYSWEDPAKSWEGPWRYTYLTLADNTDASAFEQKVNEAFRKAIPGSLQTTGVSLDLQPITDIYLNSNFKDELKAPGNKILVFILLTIACVILIIAWINYLNLETARFILRAKEVGVRRIIGSSQSDLIVQFLVEYFCVNVVAILLAVGLLAVFLPFISSYTGMSLQGSQFLQPQILIAALILFGAGSLLIGSYPAFLIARINPVQILKGKIGTVGRRFSPRKVLLTFQFVCSIVLIAFVLVVNSQLEFMKTSNKKIDLAQVVTIVNPTAYSSQEEKNKGEGGRANFVNLRNKLLQNPAIAEVSSSSAIPGETIGFTYTDLVKRDSTDPYDPTPYKLLFVDYNFISLYGLTLKAGRNYSAEHGEDENWSTLILNETAIKGLDFPSAEDAIGKEISFMVDDKWDRYKIIGVMADYHHEALKKVVLPTIFFLHHNRGQQVYYSVKLQAQTNQQGALAYIEKSWKDTFPEKPFEYFFLDEHYDHQFKSELYFGRIFTLFAGVAIFLATLGILGMTLFETHQRIKEISIRKVLGASVQNLVFLFSRSVVNAVFISALIAAPLIYKAAHEWLETYPVRIEISFLFFVVPLLLILGVVVVASCVQIGRVVRSNPVDNLKHE